MSGAWLPWLFSCARRITLRRCLLAVPFLVCWLLLVPPHLLFRLPDEELREEQAEIGLDDDSKSHRRAIALVIPYRDRLRHLQYFRRHMETHIQSWRQRGYNHTWVFFIVEQFDGRPFNRGFLFNAGFHHSVEYEKKHGLRFDCIVIHDVDAMPTAEVDYAQCQWPTQLNSEVVKWGWSVYYPEYSGGEVTARPEHWQKINGFSNEIEGWGGEDDELYQRFRLNGLLKGGCHTFCSRYRWKVSRPFHFPAVPPAIRRPPLGQGRYVTLEDKDHTARVTGNEGNTQRLQNAFRAMAKGSLRWRRDGISSLIIHSVKDNIESPSCGEPCAAPEDPAQRPRSFREHWSRVSREPLRSASSIDVALPSTSPCGALVVSLSVLLAGVPSLRNALPDLFRPAGASARSHCHLDEEWASTANFVLIDTARGDALMIGDGVSETLKDIDRAPLPGHTGGLNDLQPPIYEVQAQRWGRWLRRLPETHLGWIYVTKQSLPDLRRKMVDSNRLVLQQSTVCVSYKPYDKFHGDLTYRVQPGFESCSEGHDNGNWTQLSTFTVLRSRDNVPIDNLFPVCVARNAQLDAFRFEPSEVGCAGKDERSGVDWHHIGTFNTLKTATGEHVCVGVLYKGEQTRWKMEKSERCDSGGFQHHFSFRSVSVSRESPLVSVCLGSAPTAVEQGHSALQLRQLETPAGCDAGPQEEWRHLRTLVFLSRRSSREDQRVCLAEANVAVPPSGHAKTPAVSTMRRIFIGDDMCKRPAFVEAHGDLVYAWRISQKPLFAGPAADGELLCLCTYYLKAAQLPVYTMSWNACRGRQDPVDGGICIRPLTPEDALGVTDLLDDI